MQKMATHSEDSDTHKLLFGMTILLFALCGAYNVIFRTVRKLFGHEAVIPPSQQEDFCDRLLRELTSSVSAK